MPGPSSSPSLDALFQNLIVGDILTFVTERRPEDLTLDFKLAPSNFANRDDRKTLATAISGFANSNGGLIVWGVDARKGADDVDCAQSVQPLGDSQLFMSRLLEHSAGAASPIVPGVTHRLVEGNGGPFAATLVPESDLGPHMAKLGEDRYYKRSGDQFRRMEHFDVADMFGRRRRPVLALRPHVMSGGTTNAGGSVTKDVRVVLDLHNEGRGSAVAPYVAVTVSPSSSYRLDSAVQGRLKGVLERIANPGDTGFRFAAGADVVLHPAVSLPVVTVIGSVAVDGPAPLPLVVDYELAALDQPLTRGTATVTADEIRRALGM